MFLGGRGEGLVHVVVVKPLLESQALSPIINQDENVPIDPLLLTSTIPRALEKKKKKTIDSISFNVFLARSCREMYTNVYQNRSFGIIWGHSSSRIVCTTWFGCMCYDCPFVLFKYH